MIIISMKTSAQCSAAIKRKTIRRVENKAEEMTVQLGISVMLPGLDSCVQAWSSSLRQDTGQGSGRNDKRWSKAWKGFRTWDN